MDPVHKLDFSVIVPVHNEEANVGLLAGEVSSILEALGTWEIIFIDDGSTDGSADRLRALHASEPRCGFILLSRNFGKEAAILAGIGGSRGRAVIVMDADLQHPPRTLPDMIALWRTGTVDVVDGVKRERGRESLPYRLAAGMFNRLMSPTRTSDMRGASDFKLVDRRVADVIAAFPERVRFFRGLTEWAGFRHGRVEYDVAERKHGKTSWSTRALLRYSVSNMVSFSSTPLRAISTLGFVTIIFSLILGLDTLYMKLTGAAVEGFTTVLLSVAFFSGAIIICLGIMGEYLSRMYDELKRRPVYVISERGLGDDPAGSVRHDTDGGETDRGD